MRGDHQRDSRPPPTPSDRTVSSSGSTEVPEAATSRRYTAVVPASVVTATAPAATSSTTGWLHRIVTGLGNIVFGPLPPASAEEPQRSQLSRSATPSPPPRATGNTELSTSRPVHSPEIIRTVVIEDPRTSWFRRHAQRLEHDVAVASSTINRFTRALAQQDDGELDDRPRDYDFSGDAHPSSPDPPAENILELVPSVLWYRHAPNEFYHSLVELALSYYYNPRKLVTGEELKHAAGCPQLIRTILSSGFVDSNDPVVQEIIQSEVDRVIAEADDTPKRRVNPNNASYLKMLFHIQSTKLTDRQVDVLEESGFEFIKLLHDFPHLRRNLQAAPWWRLPSYEEHQVLDGCIVIVGLLLMVCDMVALTAIAINWWMNSDHSNFGYWTALMAVGGYVMTLLVVVVFESSKVNSSFYHEERLWEYPSYNIKVLPLVPLLEIILLVHILRYYLASRREQKQVFVITHDLHASFAHLFILHSQCNSFPQLLLQCYLFLWGQFSNTDTSFLAFRSFIVTASISVSLSCLVLVRRIAFYRSVNRAGFAAFGSDPKAKFDRGGDIRDFFPKLITFLLIFMLEYNIFFLIVAIINIKNCNTTVLVWVWIMGALVLVVVVILAYSIIKEKSHRTTGRLALIPIGGQIGFAIYASLFESADSAVEGATRGGAPTSCAFYSISIGANLQVGIATFSVLLAIVVGWMIITIWFRYQRMKGSLTTGEQLRYLLRPWWIHDPHDTGHTSCSHAPDHVHEPPTELANIPRGHVVVG